MKFSCSVDINVPINKVVELFDNEENLYHWQDGLLSVEHLSGEKGKVGAKTKMRYKVGKSQEIELIETILVHDLPKEFTGIFEAKTMTNTMTVNFTSISRSVTRYDTYIEYTKLNGLMIKIIARLMPGMFRRQTQKWLNQFRDFAEAEFAKEN